MFDWTVASQEDADTLNKASVGDIIKLGNNNYKLLKKSTTAVCVERYYFWNKWLENLFK